ncbi:MAG: hypothetical protein ACOC4M_10305, partial [Promethearchaeia archaeon]
ALYPLKNTPVIKGFIVGLGGRDIKDEHLIKGVETFEDQYENDEISDETEFIGLKLDKLNSLKGGN